MNNKITADYIEVLKNKGSLVFVPGGNSMWPFIKNKKSSVVISVPKQEPVKWDVIFFQRKNGEYVLHRIIEVCSNGYIVAGDSQNYSEFVDKQNVLGILEGYYVNKKYISVNNAKYKKRVKRWYARPFLKKTKIKLFYFGLGVKSKIRKIFKRGNKNV